MSKWLTSREAASYVRLSERAFRLAVLAGRYPQGKAAALGRRKLWREADLDAALTGDKADAAATDPYMAAIHAAYPQIAQTRRSHKG